MEVKYVCGYMWDIAVCKKEKRNQYEMLQEHFKIFHQVTMTSPYIN